MIPALPLFHRIAGQDVVVIGDDEAGEAKRRLVERAGGTVVTGWTPGARLAFVSGVISIIAGIVTFTLPSLAVSAFLIFGAILLIVVSVSTLLTLPRRHSVASM